MTAWGYYAVSSSPQEATLVDQATWAEGVARANGWRITRTFSGTASGKLGTRRILDEMLAALSATPKAERPERILLIRLDRTGRVALETIAALAKIKRLGVVLHTRTDGDVRLDSAFDALRPMFELITAELENGPRSDKMRAAHARYRDAGKHFGPAPYGTAKDADHRLIPLEPHAGFVRRAFELRATGAGYRRIARDVGRHAPPAPKTYAGRARMEAWHQASLSKMFACRSYRGLVVESALWDHVQTVRNPDWRAIRLARVYPWPLSGIVRCWCGWTLAGVASGPTKRRKRYYACHHPKAHGDARRPSIEALAAEAWFVERLHGLAAAPDLVRDFNATRSDNERAALELTLHTARAELAEVERKHTMAWDLQADGRIAAGELARRLQSLQERRAALGLHITESERALAIAVAQEAVATEASELFADAAELWATADWDAQKEIARLVALAAGGLYLGDDRTLRFGADGGPIDTTASTRALVYRLGSDGTNRRSLRTPD